MDVLLEPPLLYLELVMIIWSVWLVPRLLERARYMLIFETAVLHVIIYTKLLHLSASEVEWFLLIAAATLVVLVLTAGGFILHQVARWERDLTAGVISMAHTVTSLRQAVSLGSDNAKPVEKRG